MSVWKRRLAFLAGAAGLLAITACFEQARQNIPFLPPSNYVERGGRLLTREEAAWCQKLVDLRDAIRANPKDAVAYNTLGELFQKKGAYKSAKECYFAALKIDDTLSQVHYNLGLICFYEDRSVEALEHLEKARALSPDDARIRHRQGQVKAIMNNDEQALKDFDFALALDHDYTPAYLDKAKVLYARRRYVDAAAACRAALAHLPKVDLPATARDSHGNAILDKVLPTGQPVEPPKTWRQEAAYDLALCLKAQGQFREALVSLAGAEDAAAAKADVRLLKARLQEAGGDQAGAIATLQLLRVDFPEMAEIPKRLAALHQKTGQPQLAAKTRLEAAELDQSDGALQEEAAQNAAQLKDPARLIAIYERLVRIAPDELRYRRQLAQAYDDAGIVREAALAYQEVVNRALEDWAARRKLAFLFAGLPGFQGRATLQFKQILEKNPQDAEAHRRLGELYLQSKNFPEAEKHIRLTLAQSSRDPQALQNLATLLVGQQHYEDAVENYKQALAIDPKLSVAQLNLAKVLLGLNQREAALAPLREYLKQKPLDEDAMRLLAAALRDLGRREEAVAEYDAIAALHPNDMDVFVELGKLKNGLGDPRAALGEYEGILEKHPANDTALAEAGRLYNQLGQPMRAIYCWQRMLALKPGDHEAQTQLAAAYKASGADEAAIKTYEDAAKAGDAGAWKSVAELRLKRNERGLAAQAYREAIKLKNQDVEARRLLAGLLQTSDKREDKEEAVKLYQEIMQLDNKDLGARLNLANLYGECNRLAEAQETYDALLRDKPGYAPALLGLGVIWRRRGQYERALKLYEQALQAKPEGRALQAIYFNIGLIYDYDNYLPNPQKAQEAYEHFIAAGGDPAKIPESAPKK